MRVKRLRSFLTSDAGASMVEVALIICLMLLIAFPAIRVVGPRAGTPICKVSKVLEKVEEGQWAHVAVAVNQSAMCCIGGVWDCKIGSGGPPCTAQQQVMCVGGSGGPP